MMRNYESTVNYYPINTISYKEDYAISTLFYDSDGDGIVNGLDTTP